MMTNYYSNNEFSSPSRKNLLVKAMSQNRIRPKMGSPTLSPRKLSEVKFTLRLP